MEQVRLKPSSETEYIPILFKPCIVVIAGPPMRGKDFLARQISSKTNFMIVELDRIRNFIDPARRDTQEKRLLPPEEEFPIVGGAYATMCIKADWLVKSGQPVILAATFSRAEFKASLKWLKQSLDKAGIPLRVFLLEKPPKKIQEQWLIKRKKEDAFSNIRTMEQIDWAENFFKPIKFAPVTAIEPWKRNAVDKVLQLLQDLKV